MANLIYSFLFIIFFYIPVSAQTISGKISTSDGSPAANVNIELKNLKLFAIINENGKFIFNHIPSGNYYLHENYSVNPIAQIQFFTTLSYKF